MSTSRFQSAPLFTSAAVPCVAQFVRPQLVHRLVSSLAPDRILLFGSRARGLVHPTSDIDLLLVGTWNLEPAHLRRHARHLVMHNFPRVDIVFCTAAEIDAAQGAQAPFLRSILETGITIYCR